MHFVQHHAAAIAAIAVGVAVMAGCEATLGVVTAGAATPVCGVISGAASSAASYAVTAAETHKFSWSALGETTAEGAVAGLVGEGVGDLAGAASGLLSSGTDVAASAMTDSASGEATQAAETAEDTAGENATEAQQDAEPESCPTKGAGPTAGGESFSASTRVLLANGKTVPISDLKVGDKVKAVDTKTGKTQVETVEAVLVHHDTDLYDLTIKTAHGAEVIDTTSNHLFWDPSLDKWGPANKLSKNEHLKASDGAIVTVIGGTTPKVHDGWMWDLTVQTDHDFYVTPEVFDGSSYAATAAILVHNCGNGNDGVGFAPGEGESALTPDRLQHGSRHLTDEGLLPNWKGTTSPQLVRDALSPILENPIATFNHELGGTAVKGFIGELGGTPVAAMVFREGPNAGKLATAVAPSANQMLKWFVG